GGLRSKWKVRSAGRRRIASHVLRGSIRTRWMSPIASVSCSILPNPLGDPWTSPPLIPSTETMDRPFPSTSSGSSPSSNQASSTPVVMPSVGTRPTSKPSVFGNFERDGKED
ncbi:unnamed protein product, partial [Musa acuminata subsp. burmannicoides]